MKSKKVFMAVCMFTAACIQMNAQNPIIRGIYSADPTARVFNGKVYLYPLAFFVRNTDRCAEIDLIIEPDADRGVRIRCVKAHPEEFFHDLHRVPVKIRHQLVKFEGHIAEYADNHRGAPVRRGNVSLRTCDFKLYTRYAALRYHVSRIIIIPVDHERSDFLINGHSDDGIAVAGVFGAAAVSEGKVF